jgi:amino acid transporter
MPKWMALPVFSSDPLSSVAYATQEMMKILALAGAAAFALVLPLSLAVAALLLIVVTSYRQTVRAYPYGGGAYIVARENLGDIPALTAASALLIDYTLTVSVSIAAGVAAIISAEQQFLGYRLLLAIGFVLLVMFANLRGIKEAGVTFAIPTYAFIVTMLTLIGVGLIRCMDGCPTMPFNGLRQPDAETGLSLFLILHAFSSGSTALTGIEAISDGVPAFRYPQSRNAAKTLGIMGIIAVSLFLGVSFLATHVEGITVFEGVSRTVTSQIAGAIFGPTSIAFYMVQVMTAAILILAANTAYADFPRLSSILAADRFLPRQFLARGDRLVFSNGILVLTTLAILLLIVFDADEGRLIQLYVVGVFTSFTLSQSGMVRHWLKTRERGWQRATVINAVGAFTTGVVLLIVAYTKFKDGAWIVILAIPLAVLMMERVNRHYRQVSLALRSDLHEPETPRPNHVLILEDRVDGATATALSYAQRMGPISLRGIATRDVQPDIVDRWTELAPDVPLEILKLDEHRGAVATFSNFAATYAQRHPNSFTTAIVPETRSQSWLDVLKSHERAQRVKARLVGEGNLVVANVVASDGSPGPYEVVEPVEHHVIVLVSGVHKGTFQALAYARGLHATSVRALSINLEHDNSTRLLDEWEDWEIDTPLEIVDSPFRSISATIREYVRSFYPDGRRTAVTCVLPEFVLEHWWHRFLHNQTALLIKGTLLFEPGVVTVSIPYRIPKRGKT